MQIALDAQAGDFGAVPNLKGAIRAVEELDCKILLVGQESVLRTELEKLGHKTGDKLQIVNSERPVDMSSEPAKIVRENPNSSIMVCASLVAEGKADGMVSAGNSGATMVASLAKMKRVKNISRPAIAFPFPTTKGVSVILDGGANIDCKPRHLLEFALMGSLYSKYAFGVKNPSIGILSVGEEESKGNLLVRESTALLKQSILNFHGPIEGRDIPFGTTDVVVCDGFVGNVVLKLSEGLSKAMFNAIKAEISKKLSYKIGALMLKKAFRGVKDNFDPEKHGGAPLLGVGGITIVCHGKSGENAIFNSIKRVCNFAKVKMNNSISEGIEKLNDVLEKSSMDDALSHSENVIAG
ncbi:MAG TPA: phosphate acyltransferase PlsX [Elusimicrobiales bacterium]|nr:phosphate acyltransferase PlsX [Elusimicrobiales bacterium]